MSVTTTTRDDERCRLRARAGRHPRRGQLAGARVRERGRHAPVPRVRPGRVRHRRRRQRVRRPRRLVGSGPARPRAPRGRRGGPRRGRSRPELRRADGHGDRPRRRDPLAGPPGREGPPGLHRHRGDDDGAAPGARVHRPRPRREVRRLLPRARRRAAGLGRLRRRDPRPARLGRRLRRGHRRDHRRPVQRRRGRRGRVRASTATASPRSSRRPRPRTWASSPRCPGSTPRCAASRSRTARCSSRTRSSRASASGTPAGGGSRACARAGRPTCTRSARSSAAACRSPRSVGAGTS